MHAISKLVVPTIALLGMVQYCPAPFIPAIAAVVAGVSAADAAGVIGAAAGVAGAVEGGVSAAHGKRDASRVFNSRINKRQEISNLGLGTAWPDCISELGSRTLTFSSPDSSSKFLAVWWLDVKYSNVLTSLFYQRSLFPACLQVSIKTPILLGAMS